MRAVPLAVDAPLQTIAKKVSVPMRARQSRILPVLALLVTLPACESPLEPDPGAAPDAPNLAISDGRHGGAGGFYFLWPTVHNRPPFTGKFDATLSPVVRICRWVNEACAGSDIVIDGHGRGAKRLKVRGGSYSALWLDTRGVAAGSVYRLRVYASADATDALGFADLMVVGKKKHERQVPAGFIPLVRGLPFPIRFRIEKGAVPPPGSDPVEDEAPAVTATAPEPGDDDVAGSANLGILFSEPVNVSGDWFQIVCTVTGTRLPAATTVTGGPTEFTIDPAADFAAGESCTVTVFAAGVADQDTADPPDNLADNHVFEFDVAAEPDAAPAVTARTPAAGVIAERNANVSITFSEPVTVSGDWFQIVCTVTGTRLPAATTVTGGPTTFTIDPSADFASGETCTVTVDAAAVADQDANDPPDNLAENFVFEFPVTEVVDAAPSVTARTPAADLDDVARNTNIGITFSEPVNVTGDWFQIFCTATGVRLPANSVVSGGPTTFTIDPNNDFFPGEICTVTVVAANVTDQDADDPPDGMAANFSFQFVASAAVLPVPVNDGPAPNSVPGDDYHAFVDVPIQIMSPGLLANDVVGVPAGQISSFGGGSLGGNVTSNAAGSTVTFGDVGELTVLANGALAFRPTTGFTGAFTFQYRVTNAHGSGDATVTIFVGER